jgi:hypothetical protein
MDEVATPIFSPSEVQTPNARFSKKFWIPFIKSVITIPSFSRQIIHLPE